MTVTSGIVQPILRTVQQGTLATGPITVAVGTTFQSPNLDTTGFSYAVIWPSTVSGGVGNITRRQVTRDGALIGYDGSSNGAPPQGLTREGNAAFYWPPINDVVTWSWTNTDSANATLLGDINYTLTT